MGHDHNLTTFPSSVDRPASPEFHLFFQAAFGRSARPFTWQQDLAEGEWPEVLIAPTGSGKTAGVTLSWMYHRLRRPETTPRRLVWCLPMRALVDQTNDRNSTVGWDAVDRRGTGFRRSPPGCQMTFMS